MNERGGPRRAISGLHIGRWFGIEFYLHYSWFILATIVTYELGTEFFPFEIGGLTRNGYLGMGAIAAALFFFCILLHELGHSIVSQRCGIPVPRITLLFIGGVAEISREPDDAKSEMKIALGGPVVSLVLVVVFHLLSRVCAAWSWFPAHAITSWLSKTNLALVIFNMFPGYPLDGGRVLRAMLWARSKRLRWATYVTSRIGIGFSWLLLILGLYLLIIERQWNAFVFVIIAIFLKGAAESGYNNAVQREVLGGVRVRDFMTANPATLPDTLPLNLAVDDYFLAHHHKAYAVCSSEGDFRGLLRLERLKGIPRERWPYTTAGDAVAEEGSASLCIEASAPAARAMRLLLAPGTSRLAVVDDGKVVGMVTRRDIAGFIDIHTALER